MNLIKNNEIETTTKCKKESKKKLNQSLARSNRKKRGTRVKHIVTNDRINDGICPIER